MAWNPDMDWLCNLEDIRQVLDVMASLRGEALVKILNIYFCDVVPYQRKDLKNWTEEAKGRGVERTRLLFSDHHPLNITRMLENEKELSEYDRVIQFTTETNERTNGEGTAGAMMAFELLQKIKGSNGEKMPRDLLFLAAIATLTDTCIGRKGANDEAMAILRSLGYDETHLATKLPRALDALDGIRNGLEIVRAGKNVSAKGVGKGASQPSLPGSALELHLRLTLRLPDAIYETTKILHAILTGDTVFPSNCGPIYDAQWNAGRTFKLESKPYHYEIEERCASFSTTAEEDRASISTTVQEDRASMSTTVEEDRASISTSEPRTLVARYTSPHVDETMELSAGATVEEIAKKLNATAGLLVDRALFPVT